MTVRMIVFYRLMCRRQRPPFLPALDVRLELRAKLANGSLHRPTRAVGQAANRRPRYDPHAVAHFDEDIEILNAPAPAPNAVHDAKHPRRPLAARRTLPARLVREKAACVPQYIHHARMIVDHRNSAGAQSEQLILGGRSEIERHVEFVAGAVAHAQAPGIDGLDLAVLPTSAAVFVDQLPNRDAERRLVRARLVHVPRQVEELRAVGAGVAWVF